jgi:hypothetical protein
MAMISTGAKRISRGLVCITTSSKLDLVPPTSSRYSTTFWHRSPSFSEDFALLRSGGLQSAEWSKALTGRTCVSGEPLTAMVTLIDDHDSTERFFDGGEEGEAELAMALGWLFAFPGIPCLYYGTEQGLLIDGGAAPNLAGAAEQIRVLIGSGRLELQALARRLERNAASICKGDANFRRALEDREWPATTPLEIACCAPLQRALFLRVLKSECVAGLPGTVVAEVEQADARWRIDGRHATAQVMLRG